MNLKRLPLLLVSFSLLFIINGCFYSVGYSKTNLNKIVARGAPIITALEEYKLKNDDYPDNLNELVPEFLSEIPTTGVRPFVIMAPIPYGEFDEEGEYRYLKYTEEHRSMDPALSGYRLMVIVDPMTVLDDENIWKLLLYRSSNEYPRLRLERPKERIGDWRVVVRDSGSIYTSGEDSFDFFNSY